MEIEATQMHLQRGFTLIELMITIAVLAILLGIAIPAFNEIVRSNQIAAQSNSVMSALALARSEAVKRGVRVSLCSADSSSPNASNCSTAPNWDSGWIVFSDDFGAVPGAIDASDVILQRWPAMSNGTNVASADFAVTFARSGRAEFQRSFTVSKVGCGQNQRRTITVDLSGRVSLARSNC
jgi:type IV fimbrial biogenesis protein FimT